MFSCTIRIKVLLLRGQKIMSVETEEQTEKFKGFVAVHIGAGYHSPANCELYEKVCRQACQQAIQLLKQKKTALEAVTAAVVSLEDSQWTNAGLGSNLSLTGSVECDASIMDGKSLHFGAVGAVSGVSNPILVAESLLRTQMAGEMSLGRVAPSTLVAHGAHDWAVRHKIPTCPKDDLITDSSRKAYMKNKRKLDIYEDGLHGVSKYRKIHEEKEVESNEQLTNGCSTPDIFKDTVGAICVDDNGSIASAVSSGGIILKQPGRLGQAALYGCGCWAENDTQGKVGVGVSTSGCGEQLSKTLLAKACGDCLKDQQDPTNALYNCFTKKFLESPYLRNEKQPLGGAVAVTIDSSNEQILDVEVLWAHTTDSMCLAFMSSDDTEAEAFVSRLPVGIVAGKAVIIRSKSVNITGGGCS